VNGNRMPDAAALFAISLALQLILALLAQPLAFSGTGEAVVIEPVVKSLPKRTI